jgi:hypothetical protein
MSGPYPDNGRDAYEDMSTHDVAAREREVTRLLQEVADRESVRLAAIRSALAHPLYYDGDIGADIRWLLANVAALKHQLIGANEMKAKFEQSAAEGWTNYREMKAAIRQVRERFANYRSRRPRSFNGEMADEVALEREDQLMDLFLRALDAIANEADK